MLDEGDAFAPGDTSVGRQRFARHRRQEFQHPTLRGDARDQRRPEPASRRWLLPPPSRLQLPQGPHTVLGRHSRPQVLVQPADVVLRAEVPASPQEVLHERHMAPDKPLFVAHHPTRHLPRRHGLHHARAWPRNDSVTSAVRVEGHVLRREPASRAHGRPGETAVPAALSVPFNLLPEGRNAEENVRSARILWIVTEVCSNQGFLPGLQKNIRNKSHGET